MNLANPDFARMRIETPYEWVAVRADGGDDLIPVDKARADYGHADDERSNDDRKRGRDRDRHIYFFEPMGVAGSG